MVLAYPILGPIIPFVALAAEYIIVDMVAYFYVSIRYPFYIGDLIDSNGITSRVIDMDILEFNRDELGDLVETLSPTGCYVSMLNRFIFSSTVYNYKPEDSFVMQEVDILVGFDVNREEALRIAGKVAHEKYTRIIDNYDEEQLEVFNCDLEYHEYNRKPKNRAELDANGFRIYIQYFSSVTELGKNRMIMQNGLYDAFEAKNIEMPIPMYIRIEQ